jgi:hypothetical protein
MLSILCDIRAARPYDPRQETLFPGPWDRPETRATHMIQGEPQCPITNIKFKEYYSLNDSFGPRLDANGI